MNDVCRRLGLEPLAPKPGTKVGLSQRALAGDVPLHGLRHRPTSETCGWYIWSGELELSVDFFAPCRLVRGS
jgi:hypothetical protein